MRENRERTSSHLTPPQSTSAQLAFTQPTTPFPSVLLDSIMPALKDTEWRLLCVIVRQTVGWKDNATGKRKTSDWLTQRQLIQRTGRRSEALSRALDALVRQNLIEVQGSSGRPLDTAPARRQARGRIRYALHSRFVCSPSASFDTRKGEYREPDSRAGYSLYRLEPRKSEFPKAAKANGTKETTKETLTKENTSFIFDASKLAVSESGEEWHTMDEPTERFIYIYRQRYAAHRPGTMPPTISTPTVTRLQSLLSSYPPQELLELLETFFTCGLGRMERQDYSLDAFTHSTNVLRLSRNAKARNFLPPERRMDK